MIVLVAGKNTPLFRVDAAQVQLQQQRAPVEHDGPGWGQDGAE